MANQWNKYIGNGKYWIYWKYWHIYGWLWIFQINVGLGLRCDICQEFQCGCCGETVDQKGIHSLGKPWSV